MKSGDVVVDNNGKEWLIFDVADAFLYVIDHSTQKFAEVLLKTDIKEVIEMPTNVKSMFLQRRLNNLKGMEKYL